MDLDKKAEAPAVKEGASLDFRLEGVYESLEKVAYCPIKAFAVKDSISFG